MAFDYNTDYMAVMNAAETKAKNAATDAERAAAQSEYAAAQASRNEKIAAMNAAGTNTAQVTQTNNSIYTPQTVSYIDSNGEKKQGYILDGKTYTDAAGQNRVGVGSVVNTGGGLYRMTENGGQKLNEAESYLYKDAMENNQLSGLRQQLQAVQSALTNAQSSNDAVYAAQLRQQQAKLQQQINKLTRSYDDANRQLYIEAMKQKVNTPQALAAMGYTGGLRESSLLGIDTQYANQLAENERAKQSDIAELQAGMNDTEAELAIAKLQQDAADQQTYDTRYLAILQQIAEQEAQKAAEEETTPTYTTPTYTAPVTTPTYTTPTATPTYSMSAAEINDYVRAGYLENGKQGAAAMIAQLAPMLTDSQLEALMTAYGI